MKSNKWFVHNLFARVVLPVLTFCFLAGLSASRVSAQSALDGFNPNANSTVRAVAVQPDGKILISGEFTTVMGVARNRIARLNTDGTLDMIFNPNADAGVYAIAVQPDGSIVVGGGFSNIGGQSRSRIARLDGVSGLPDSWNPNANSIIVSLTLQPDGKILAGGNFATIGGQSRSLFARLSNDTAALSTLTVGLSSVKLIRDGSAPQFTRVVFEKSTDNGANWALLGTATGSFASLLENNKGENSFAPQAAGYTLTGVTIPTGQNVLIRARGFYRTGYQSGSETTEDKVRNVFNLAPTAASVSVSGRVFAGKSGLTNAFVTLTDSSGNARTARTSAFGYYRFDDVEVGRTYILSVQSKRFQFPTQVVNVVEELSEFNFFSNDEGLR